MAMEQPNTSCYGLLARFETPKALVAAAEKTKAAGYRDTEAFTPFPVHGMAEALGKRKSRLAAAVLIGGILGASGGLLLQWWISSIVYPHIVSGKPFFSWPSFFPVVFECTILGASLTSFFTLFGRSGLPRPYHPIFNSATIDRASTDGFFLMIEATDSQFDEAKTQLFLDSLNPAGIEVVPTEEAHPA